MATTHGTHGGKIAKMEAAIEVLGIQVARALDARRAEEEKPSPDRRKIDELTAQIRTLSCLQEDLTLDDPRVDQIRLEANSIKASSASDVDLPFDEEALALAYPTLEDEAAFEAYIDAHGRGTGDAPKV